MTRVRDPNYPLHPEIRAALERLETSEPGVRIDIIRGLTELGGREASLDAMEIALTHAVHDDDPGVSAVSLRAVAEIGEESADSARLAIPLMVRLANDQRASVERRGLAMRAIGEIGERWPELYQIKMAISEVMKMLDGDLVNLEPAPTAFWTLREIGLQRPDLLAPERDRIQRMADEHTSPEIRRRASELLDQVFRDRDYGD